MSPVQLPTPRPPLPNVPGPVDARNRVPYPWETAAVSATPERYSGYGGGATRVVNTNQMPSPWETALVGAAPERYSGYGGGATRVINTNQMPSPWETNAAGVAAGRYTYYGSGIRLQATNLATNPNLEGGSVLGWLSNNATQYSVVASTTSPISGAYSAMSTVLVQTPNGAAASVYLGNPSAQIPITGGQLVTASVDVKVEKSDRLPQVYFLFYRADNTTNGQASSQSKFGPVLTSGAVTRLTVTAMVPSDVVKCYVIVAVTPVAGTADAAPGPPVGERVWFDNLRVSQGAATADVINLHPNPRAGDTYLGGSTTYWISNSTAIYGAATLDSSGAMNGSRFSIVFARQASTPNSFPTSMSLGGMQTGTMLPVTAGVPVTAALDVRPELGNRNVRGYFTWWDAAGTTLIATSPTSAPVNLAAGTVTRFSYTQTPPTGAAGARFVVYTSTGDGSNAITGERTWFDNAAVVAGSTAYPGFSGHDPVDGTYAYTWTGNVGASTSQRWKVTDQQMADYLAIDGDKGTQEPYVYAWTGTARASTSTKSLTATNSITVVTGAGTGLPPEVSSRPVLQATNLGGNNQTGCRTSMSANIVQGLSAGVTFTFSAWVRISSGYPLFSGGLQVLFRDDPNNDSVAAPITYVPVTPGTWTRISVTGTVKAGRTVTGIYLIAGITSGLTAPIGSYLQTTGWQVTLNNAAVPYFDGDTPYGGPDGQTSYAWTGTRGASTSVQQWVGSVTASVDGGEHEGRPTVRATHNSGAAVFGLRTLYPTANVLQGLVGGMVATLSAWVFVSPGVSLVNGGVRIVCRDDPNNDSNAVWFADSNYRPVTVGQWSRVSVSFTVLPGRTVTGIYVLADSVPSVFPAGAYLQTTQWMVSDGPALLPYFDGGTPKDTDHGYRWSGAMPGSVSERYRWVSPVPPVDGPVDGDNRATNPGLEGGSLAGWNSTLAGSWPLTLDQAAPIWNEAGPSKYAAMTTRATWATASGVIGGVTLTGMVSGAMAGIDQGVPLTLGLDVRAEAPGRGWFQWNVFWFDPAGVGLTPPDAGWVRNTPDFYPGVTQRLVRTVSAPAGAAQFRVNVECWGYVNDPVGQRAWFDNFRISQYSDPPYFDGDSPDTANPHGFRWVSTPRASVSNRYQLLPGTMPPVVQLPKVTDPLADAGLADVRMTGYRFELLDSEENFVALLDGVTGGSLSWTWNTAIKGGGTLAVTDVGQRVNGAEIDWLNSRIRPVITVYDLENLVEEEFPQGVFLPAAPVEEWTDEGLHRNIELLDKLSILDTDIYTVGGRPATYTLPKNSNVVAAVVTLIRLTGEDTPAIVADETAVLAAGMTWDMGTTLLQICNDLLAAAGYYSLWTDEQGQFRVEPYVDPLQRPPIYELDSPFSYGELSRLDPAWQLDYDIYDTPNRVVLIGQGSDDAPAWVATAINNNPNSPFSYSNRGRWISYVLTEVEATSQATLQASAVQRLGQLTAETRKVSVKHPFLPDLRIGGLVRFTNPRADLDTWCYVSTMEVVFDPIGQCSTGLLEVAGQ